MATRTFSCHLDDAIERTESGSIRVNAFLARTGMQEYNKDGRLVIEYRPPSEVFRDETLASFRGATITDTHPASFVDTKNWRKVACGHVGDDVKQNGDFVQATLHINDEALIKEILAGQKRELSAGYDVTIDETPGEIDGRMYDRVQRNIVANHVAVLPPGQGRAGHDVAIRLDGNDNDNGETHMEITVRLDGKDITIKTQEEAQHVIDELIKAHVDSMAAMTADRDSTAKQLTESTAKLAEATSSQRVDALVAERLKVVEQARRVMRTDSAFDGKNNTEIKRLAIGERANDKSEDWVDGAFDALHASCVADATLMLRTQTSSGASSDIDALQQRIDSRAANAWKVKGKS